MAGETGLRPENEADLTEYMYGHRYFDGIGSGSRVAATLEAASMTLPAEALEDLKAGRGMFREQGALLGYLGRKGKVMREDPPPPKW